MFCIHLGHVPRLVGTLVGHHLIIAFAQFGVCIFYSAQTCQGQRADMVVFAQVGGLVLGQGLCLVHQIKGFLGFPLQQPQLGTVPIVAAKEEAVLHLFR